MIGARPVTTQVSLSSSSTEYSHTFAKGVSRATIKLQGITATLRVSFESGGTGGGSNEYITLAQGQAYTEKDAKLSEKTVYLKASANTQVAEISEWIS